MYYELLKNELDIYEKNTLQYAYLSITNYCNANCVFCDVHENLQKNPQKKLFPLFDDMKIMGVKFVHFMGGGEPTTNELFWKYCEYLTDIGIKILITTNGFSLLDNGIESYTKYNIDTIFISIDSHISSCHDALRRKMGLWEKATTNIKEIKKINPNINIVINHVISKANILAFDDMINLKKAIPFDYINIIRMKDYRSLEISDLEWAAFVEKYSRFTNDMPYQKAVILSPMINKNNVPCFFPSYSVYIDCPTGNVFPCDCTVHRKDENYCLGNIYEKSLQVIWKDKKIKDIRNKLRKQDCLCINKCDATNKYMNKKIIDFLGAMYEKDNSNS